ncbi:MAG: YceI family protein, partial [Bdellovibrionales bacterium]|nr:YceI family protein [Bdellovibrionales bacterium]
MKKLLFLFFASAVVFSACTEPQQNQDPTACECYQDMKAGTTETPLYAICMKKLADNPEFKIEYTKCQYAELTGKAPKDVVLPEKTDVLELKIPADGTYNITTDKSEMRWVGKKFTGDQHSGTVGIQSGFVTISEGKVSAAEIMIDMTAMTDRSIKDEEKKQTLLGHLKSADFFDVENHPTAKFVMTDNSGMGNFKGEIMGDLTIKGQTHPVKVDLVLSQNGEMGMVSSGSMIFDRTEYGIKYKSESVFSDLGDAAIR